MYLTKREVSEAFGVASLTVDNWVAKKRLAPVKELGRVLFPKSEVSEEINRQITEAKNKIDDLTRALKNLELDEL